MAAFTVDRPTSQLFDRLVEIAEAQTAAIESWDLDTFTGLLEERAAVQQALESLGLDAPESASVEALQRVAEIDGGNIGRVLSMIEETARSLDDLHRGQIALNGYGLPGAEPAQRGHLLDKMR